MTEGVNMKEKGKGVLVVTYGMFRDGDEGSMMFAVGNEVGEPFKGHAVAVDVDVVGRNGTATMVRNGLYWRDGVIEDGDQKGKGKYVVRLMGYRDDLKVTLCSENKRVLSEMSMSGAATTRKRWFGVVG